MSASRTQLWWSEVILKQLVWPIHYLWHFSSQRLVRHFVTIFMSVISSAKCHLWLYQISPERKSCYEFYCANQRWNSNSCYDHHMLGDMFCNQLLVSHLVATFSVGDQHDSGPTDYQTRQSEKACSFCCLGPHAKYIPKCRDYHRLKMSWPCEWPRVGCKTKCHQACDWCINC